MDEQPRDAHLATASPKRSLAGPAWRRLLLGACVLLVAAAVLTGLVASRDDSKVPTPPGIPAHPTLAFSPDGDTLVTDRLPVSNNAGIPDKSGLGGIQFWDVAARKRREPPSHNLFGSPGDLSVSPDGATVAAVYELEQVHFLAPATGKAKGQPIGGHVGSLTGLAYSADGHTIVTSDWSGLHFWDAATHNKRADLALPGTQAVTKKVEDGATAVTPGAGSVGRFALSPDGRTLAILRMRGYALDLWRLE